MSDHHPQPAPPQVRPLGRHPLTSQRVTTIGQHHLTGQPTSDVLRYVVDFKGDFGLCHAPVGNFYGNWLWWHATALAYNAARWMRVLALPEAFVKCRGKRLRLCFLNVAAKVVRHARQTILRLPRAYTYAEEFIAALHALRALPVFA